VICARHLVTQRHSVNIPRDLFEKLYLSPETQVKGDLRKTFGNPTPLCLAGFLVSSTTLACDLMGWRGAGGGGAASIPVYIFMGGVLQIMGGLLEFFLGNTFPFVVFSSFGGFWISFGATLMPFFNAGGAFSSTGLDNPEGLASPGFAASFAFFPMSMGILCFIFLICSVRTNVVFVFVFACLVTGFGLLAGVYWNVALGNAATAASLQIGGGAVIFVLSIAGWYIFAAQLLEAVDFPFALPVGDLSTIVKGRSARLKAREHQE